MLSCCSHVLPRLSRLVRQSGPSTLEKHEGAVAFVTSVAAEYMAGDSPTTMPSTVFVNSLLHALCTTPSLPAVGALDRALGAYAARFPADATANGWYPTAWRQVEAVVAGMKALVALPVSKAGALPTE